jgi:hypothetical protein
MSDTGVEMLGALMLKGEGGGGKAISVSLGFCAFLPFPGRLQKTRRFQSPIFCHLLLGDGRGVGWWWDGRDSFLDIGVG